jgi:hypothetical protein
MGKSTMATRLPRRLEENMKIVGEQIKLPDSDVTSPIISLRELIAASHAIEEAEEKGLVELWKHIA